MTRLAIAVVLVSMAAGFALVGSRSDARGRRLDERRVDDLRRLSAAVDLFRTRHGALPGAAADLVRDLGDGVTPSDPLTAKPYSYWVVDADTYDVCAEFHHASEPDGFGGGQVGFWSHHAGHQCFELTSRTLQR